jgi:hypothetical protein
VLRFPKSEHIPDAAHESLILTVVYWPPERICATDLEMDGFSATHNTRMYYAKITVVVSGDVNQEGGADELMSKESATVTWGSGVPDERLWDRVGHVGEEEIETYRRKQ